MSNKRGLFALSPLMVFIMLYLVTSIVARDFYKVPISVAFVVSSIYAIATTRKETLATRIETFSKGASTSNIMLMLWIFILAGSFASSAKAMGAIEATVNLMLTILPDNMLLAGLFLAACFISISIGTSVGTIVALVPIAAGLAHSTGTSISFMTAIVVGGAFFGDNLSFISDTTIAATSTQGCKMNDKFKANSLIVIPVALIVLAIYIFFGLGTHTPASIPEVGFTKVLPYIVVLITAVVGMNVMTVLTIGIILTGTIGILDGSYDFYGWFRSMGDGIMSMGELIIITMLAGGLFEVVRKNGGIDYLISKTTSHIHSKRGAEMIIGLLVAAVDFCTANNTVAIITMGGIAQKIGVQFGLNKARIASILDTFSCCMQGIIPYGAQMLMAAGLSKISPLDIMPHLYYPYILGICTIVCIIVRFPKRYC